jgi:hypothetical protein
MSQEDLIDFGTDDIASGSNQADAAIIDTQTETPAQAASASVPRNSTASTSGVDPLDVDQGDQEVDGDDSMSFLSPPFMDDGSSWHASMGTHAQVPPETGMAEDDDAPTGNHAESPAQQTPAGAAQGAAPEEDEDPLAWTRLSVPQHQCGNCGEMGHSVGLCLWPVDEQGFLSGCCPFCNTRRHDVFDCPLEKKLADFFHVLVKRRPNRPVIQCPMELWEIDPERWQNFEGRPWTPESVKKNMELLCSTDPHAIRTDADWPVDPVWTSTKGMRARPANLMLQEHLRRRMAMPPIVLDPQPAPKKEKKEADTQTPAPPTTKGNSKKRAAEAPPEGVSQGAKRQQTARARDMRLFFNNSAQNRNGQATRGGRRSQRGPSTQSAGRGARRGRGPQRGQSARQDTRGGRGSPRGQPAQSAGRGARGGFSQRDESAQPVDRSYHPRRDTGFATPGYPTRVREPLSQADDEIYSSFMGDTLPLSQAGDEVHSRFMDDGGMSMDDPMGSSRNPPTQQRRILDTRPSRGLDQRQAPVNPNERRERDAAAIEAALIQDPD